MANEQNLVPNDKRTPSERRRNASKAGRASGAVRRRRKALREDLQTLLVTKIIADDGTEKTTQEAIVLALIDAAIKGDVKAFLAIRDTIGEKPAEKLEANVESKSAPVIVFDIPKPPDTEEPRQP